MYSNVLKIVGGVTILVMGRTVLLVIPAALFFCGLIILAGYSFLSAALMSPAAPAPGRNVPPPLTRLSSPQEKDGEIMATIFTASNQMRSNLYCDALGNNCTPSVPLSGSGITSLTAGPGIVLNPTTITSTGSVSLDVNYIQRRISGVCPAGQALRSVNIDGTVVCQAAMGLAGTCTRNGLTYSQGFRCRIAQSSCSLGFSSGSSTSMITCQADGTWAPSATGCVAQPPPEMVCP